MITYQDYLDRQGESVADFVRRAINEYQSSFFYKIACMADDYARQNNTTITNFVPIIYKAKGGAMENIYTSNNRIASNFFARLNTQRCTYSLGNGLTFAKQGVKEKFGKDIDAKTFKAGRRALDHGVSFFFLSDELYIFKATEFAMLYDEYTSVGRAGIRFWKLAPDKPLIAVFYEEDGYTKFAEDKEGVFRETEPKRAYIQKISYTEVAGEEVIGEQNYSRLPIVPFWGSSLHQSTLVGMRAAIDAYDLVLSGFANNLADCAEVYWIIENYGGMQPDDLANFLEKLRRNHIAEADTADGGRITPYSQEIPTAAREAFLNSIKTQIYQDYGALDVHAVAAGATNDHIDAAYQPMDENADDFEMQIIECFQQLGALLGISPEDATPLFKRNRISNQREQVEMLIMESEYLDEKTILEKLPNITVDEVEEILKRKDAEDMDRLNANSGTAGQPTETELIEVV